MKAATAKRWRRRGIVLAVGLVAWGVAVMLWSSLRDRLEFPEPEDAEAWHVGHRIEDRNGTILRELPTDHDRRGRPLPLEAIGQRVITATVVSEDADFFEHDGVDRTAILRAAVDNVTSGRVVSGASTITQQLVKLLDTRGVPERRTLSIKITEAARAQNLEAAHEKAEILVEYLNRLPYGHGFVGPEAAAQGYFGVASKHLSWAQAAYLAIVPRAPAVYDPVEHPERVRARQLELLEALHEDGHLDDDALARAKAEPIVLQPIDHPFLAPHFVETLRIEQRLTDAPITRTTLDLDLQRDVEGLIATHMATMNEFSTRSAAVMVVDNPTGEILAWVGSADFDDASIAGQVDLVRSARQPGSTLKPFVYALAFAGGMSSSALVPDVPTSFREGPGHGYVPQNFHGDFVGPVAAREALAASLNVPAVRLLADAGTDSLLALLRDMGVDSLTEDAQHYGLSLALGSGEVELRELAEAYATLARGGRHLPLRYSLDEPETSPREVLPPAIAAAVTEALSDPLARARLVAGRSPFSIGFDVAVKTGTSTGYRDAWTAGYTAERTVVVWVGNPDGRPTKSVTGASGAGGLFGDVMRRTMRDVGQRAPLWDPALLEPAEVCPMTGLRATDACPHAVTRQFVAGQVPTESCDVHVHGHADPRSPAGFVCDAEAEDTLVVLPQAYDTWLHAMPRGAPGHEPDGRPWLPASEVPGCGVAADGPPTLEILEPAEGAIVWVADESDRVEIVADVSGDPGFRGKIEIVVDGEIAATVGRPYRALVKLSRGDHEVLARPVDPGARFALRAVAFAVR